MNDRRLNVVRCPRCGYDLRGVVAAWEDRCPLEGVCSECGLAVRWAEVLRPDYFAPQWCVEFVPRRRDLPVAAVRTMLRSCRPWSFWRSLKMSQPIRWRRLIGYVLFVFVLSVVVGYVIEQTAVAVGVRWKMQQRVLAWQSAVAGQLQRMQVIVQSPGFSSKEEAEQQSYVQTLQAYRALAARPGAVNHSYAAAWFEAVFKPTARVSAGTVVGGRWPQLTYPAPCQLHGILLDSSSGWGGGRLPGLADWLFDRAMLTGWWVVAYALLPACFVCLPVSRRRAKVRWAHLGRITLYGLLIPWLVMLGTGLLVLAAMLFDPSDHILLGMATLLVYAMLPAITFWWAVAIGRYLKMPHGWAIAVLLMAMALLVPLAIPALPIWFQ